MAGLDARFDFYDQRLPADVTTAKRFNAWWRRQRSENPDLLAFTLGDLLPGHQQLDLGGFPDVWDADGRAFALQYEFDATSPIDGLTIDVPVEHLASLDAAPFTWSVPGLRTDLIEAVLRSLPKQVRKEFIPIAETAAQLSRELVPEERSIVDAVADHLALRAGIGRELLLLGPDSVPPHLRPTFRIVGADGEMLAAGKDLGRLQARMDARARAALEETDHHLEMDGLTDWPALESGGLPDSVERVERGHRITAYPAMVDERRTGTGEAVAIRLLATPGEQRIEGWLGCRRLLELGLTVNRRGISDRLTNHDRLALAVGPYGSVDRWIDDVIAASLDEVIRSAGGPPRTAARFRALDAWAVRRLPDLLDVVAEAGIRMVRIAASVESALSESWPTAAAGAVADVRRQLDRLHDEDALMAAGLERLDHVVRYLSAIEVRLERLRLDPRRDQQLAAEIGALEAEIERLSAAEQIVLSRRLEELRVSVFAQHLGTDGPVSAKRIRRAIADAAATTVR